MYVFVWKHTACLVPAGIYIRFCGFFLPLTKQPVCRGGVTRRGGDLRWDQPWGWGS